MWWLTVTGEVDGADGTARLRSELEALLAFAADLDRRLAMVGVGGLAGTLALHRGVTSVLDGISAGDLDRMRAEVRDAVGRLAEVTRRLDDLRRLKELLDF